MLPKTNTEFWTKKFAYNVSRDKENYQKLQGLGWNVIIVWGCEVKEKVKEKRLAELYYEIKSGNRSEFSSEDVGL